MFVAASAFLYGDHVLDFDKPCGSRNVDAGPIGVTWSQGPNTAILRVETPLKLRWVNRREP